MQKEIVAAIDVGSNALRMKIGELKNNGEFKELEVFRRVAPLGHDTFTNAKVSFETVERVCQILKVFRGTMDDYGIKTYKALATSAVREASNRAYIIDQIKLRTGVEVSVVDNSEEQFLTHKAIKSKLPEYEMMIKEGAVIIVIGAGSIQIIIYKNGELVSSQNVKMGALRVKEVLGSLESETLKYLKILDEYITVNMEGLDLFDKTYVFKHFIAVGGEISVIRKMTLDDNLQEGRITQSSFNQLYNQLIHKSTAELETEYGIRRDRAEILVPSLMLIKKFMEQAKADTIVAPTVNLCDGIIRDIYEDLMKFNKKDKSIEDIVTNAKVIAGKFGYNQKHCTYVEAVGLQILDKLKKQHGLENDRVLLSVAANLHDVGKYIGLDRHYEHSYNIIKSLEIFGLSKEQIELIAGIARFHDMQLPMESERAYQMLKDRERVLLAKMVAILRLADALDRSHKQKITNLQVRIRDKEIWIKGNAIGNTKLEEWSFNNKTAFFKDVFGLTPVLRIMKDGV